MARRIWVIAEKDEVEQSDIDAAKANNCPEIANGIPPVLEGIVLEAMLPFAYEEMVITGPEPEPVRDPLAEIDKLKANYDTLKGKVEALEKK